MRRVAMLVGMVGLMAMWMAALPTAAQARDGWWGYPSWREQAWRRHEWREHRWRPWYYNQGYYAPRSYY